MKLGGTLKVSLTDDQYDVIMELMGFVIDDREDTQITETGHCRFCLNHVVEDGHTEDCLILEVEIVRDELSHS